MLDRCSQLSIEVGDNEFAITTSAQKYVHFEFELNLNHPNVPTK